MGKTCSLILPYVHYVHVICLFAISFISHFNFGGQDYDSDCINSW